MELKVLGPIEVRNPDLRPLGGPVQRRALAMLALQDGRAASVDQLVDGIWPDGDVPARAEHNVRTYVHRLRTAIGDEDRIETVGSGYRLHLDRDEFDVFRFEDLVDEARAAADRGEPERAHALLEQAMGLWRGRPYDEIADHDWARGEIARLDELRASAVEHLLQASLDAGRHTEIVGELTEAVAEEPFRERRRIQLALALYRAGRQAEAVRAIQAFRAELAEELGLDPSPELDELEHRILEHDPGLLPPSHQRHRLRGYDLDEVIGEGAFSLVWRGTQPALGRTVAVKQIRAELANQPDFVRRFETEAQTVAALEHPFIVPLYDYWREPDSAYLVMRYVSTGTLESAVLQSGLDEAGLRRLVEQVGSALHAAHRVGVIHRDVKSANVLIDGAGNFYLTDFGIAFTGSVADDELATALSTGSPAYASPEQLRRQSLDHRTDVYGFGITLFEAATGRLPFVDAPSQAALVQRQLEDVLPTPSSVEPTVPPWVDEVVARATAKNPSDRYSTMAELVAALPAGVAAQDHAGATASATVIGTLVNPFKALRAFREADAGDFFGRDRLVTRFVEVLSRPGSAGRVLAVVGPSGSGKSSAVRSGLVPRIRQGAMPGSDEWFVTTMHPGGRPFEELESALSRLAVRQPGPLVEMMRGDERGIARAVNQILPDEDSELLVVIDQFEELFTLTGDGDRVRFLDGLLEAVREPRARLRVVVTIRADFWDRPLRHPGLAARLETAAVTVSPLAADELEAAIVEPVRRQGAAYEPGLVARIIADVGDQPGALPLLQYALTELFDRHVSGLIRAQAYDEIGGLTGALASRAEATYEALTADQRVAARRLFGRLVSLGERTEDTRRRVRVAELGGDTDTDSVVDAFGAARMLVFDVDPTTREPTVEIAHEALLRAWPRLRAWLDEDRDGIRIHRHVTDTAAAWLASDRDPGELYRGGRLETAETWAVDHRLELNGTEAEFLDASVTAHEAEQAAERQHLEQQVRSNRRLRVLASVAAVVALVAAAAGVFALQQRSRADENARAAEQRAAEAEAERARADENAADARTSAAVADVERVRATAFELRDRNLPLGLLLAVEARRLDPGLAGDAALHRLLSDTEGVFGSVPVNRLGRLWLDDAGHRAVTQGFDSVVLWDLHRLTPIRTVPRAIDPTARVDVSFAAGAVAIADATGVSVLDLETGTETPIIDAARAGSAFVDVSFSPDGTQLALAVAGHFEVWTIAAPTPRLEISRPIELSHVAWHPSDDASIVVTVEGDIQLLEHLPDAGPRWSAQSTGQMATFEPRTIVTTFDSDASVILVSGVFDDSSAVHAVSMVDGSVVGSIEDLPSLPLGRVFLDEDELQILLALLNDEARAYDLRQGVEIERPFRAQGLWDMTIDATPGRLVTVGDNGITIRSLEGGGPLERRVEVRTATPGEPAQFEPTFSISADGTSLLVSDPINHDVVAYDLTDEQLRPTPTGLTGHLTANHGHTALVGDSTVLLLDNGRPAGDPIAVPIDTNFVEVSPDGRFIAIARQQGPVLLHRSSGELVSELSVSDQSVTSGHRVTFASDGSMVALSLNVGSGAWAIFDTETGETVHRDDGREFVTVMFTGDHLLAQRATRDSVQIRLDPVSYRPTGEPLVGHTGNVAHTLDDGAGERIATLSADGTARVWDVATGVQLGDPIQTNSTQIQWADDGNVLVTADPGYVSIHNYDTSTWPSIACEVAGRNMTRAEWEEFGPRTVDYRATCSQYPLEP